jgi:predicted phage terminase large subunit-like protein
VYRVQSLDPSKGADAKSGDYQAHVLLGLGRMGTMYAEAVLAREPIPQMIARALDLTAQSGFGRLDSLAVEDNDSLGLVFAGFREELRKQNRVVPLEAVRNTQNKVVRVRYLGIYLARSGIRFRNTRGTRMLVDQLRDFPRGTFDDGPDALELAVRRLELLANPR